MIKENTIIKSTELAKILNLSDRHIRRLAEENVIVKNGQGKYLLLESLQNYISYLNNKNAGDEDLKDQKLREEIEKIKKDTELKEIKIQELTNQLHPASIVKEVMTTMLTNIKGKFLSLPNKLAPSIIGCENLAEIQEKVLDGIVDILNELSEYNPELFKTKEMYEEEEEEKQEIKKVVKIKNAKKRGIKEDK